MNRDVDGLWLREDAWHVDYNRGTKLAPCHSAHAGSASNLTNELHALASPRPACLPHQHQPLAPDTALRTQ